MKTSSVNSIYRQLLLPASSPMRVAGHLAFWTAFICYHMVFFLPIFPERIYSYDTRLAYLLYYARFIPIYYLTLMCLSLIGQPSHAWYSPLLGFAVCLAAMHLVTKPLYHFYENQFGLENLPRNFKPIGSYYLKSWIPVKKADYYVFVYDLMDMQLLALPFGLKWVRLGAMADLQSSKLQKQRLQEELTALRAQLDSHFVLNVINAASVEVCSYSAKGSEYLAQAADLIGFTLYQARSEFVQIQTELEFISKYLALEAMRTSRRSKIVFEVEGKTTISGSVPTLLITTLVENALKHGVHATDEPSYVKITCQIYAGSITLQVFNTKPSSTPSEKEKTSRSGLGLVNLRRRLEAYFPGRHQLEITERPQSFLVYLHFPLMP